MEDVADVALDPDRLVDVGLAKLETRLALQHLAALSIAVLIRCFRLRSLDLRARRARRSRTNQRLR